MRKLQKFIFRSILRSILRIIIVTAIVLLLFFTAYQLWTPGKTDTSGKFDRGENGIWIQHGWLGDNDWFAKYKKDKMQFRQPKCIEGLATNQKKHDIIYVFPHLCPASENGTIPSMDNEQIKDFFKYFKDFKVLPWVGGILDKHVFLNSAKWRKNFINSTVKLLQKHPEFSGIHINIEPLPSGNPDFIKLLKELKTSLPENKILSIAAYPPPTIWHRFPSVHWEKRYYAEVSKYADQMVVMMYDTSIRDKKVYQWLIAQWTRDVLQWSDKNTLLGIPVYNDADTGYHNPEIENLNFFLMGMNKGLSSYQTIPENFKGVCLYSEWEMDKNEWKDFSTYFLGKSNDTPR